MFSRCLSNALCTRKFLPIMRQKSTLMDIDLYETKVTREVKEGPPGQLLPATVLENCAVPKPLPFNGPERDHINFPRITLPEKPGATRFCFIPEEWFQFLKPKLGVSGPYTLMIGFWYFMLSKEIYILNTPEHVHFKAFILLTYFITQSGLIHHVGRFLNEFAENEREALEKFDKYNLEFRKEAIEHEKREQWRQEGKQLLFDAKKENVGLQLEAVYRNNFMNIYKQVKRRLDYQVEVNKIDERIKRQFMVEWVIDRVKESISKTSEKDTLKQCIVDLNALAARM